MINILQKIDDLVSSVPFVCVVILIFFYLSVKKCFAKEGEKPVSLFLLTLLMNPATCFFLSLFLASAVGLFFARLMGIDYSENLHEGVIARINGAAGAVFNLSLILLFARLMAKRKDMRLRPAITFLFLMYDTVFLNQIRYFEKVDVFGIPGGAVIISIVTSLISLYIIWYFYRNCVIPLSEMNLDGAKIEWKVFLVPPSVFILIYYSFATSELLTNDNGVLFTISLFSMVIVCLFVWAFTVIIKNIRATNEAEKAKDEVKTLSVEVMEALAHTIDAKDEYTIGHSVRVAKYSRMIAERMGLSAGECENVYYMGLLHDIGKIGVPNEIINSPTKLTDEEYRVIKTHPGLGFEILAEIKSRPDLSTGARWHHERYDGRGYPDGKAGEEIPLFARIIAVADSYDAMTSNRSYRQYLPQDVVRSEIEKNSGTQFDPAVAACMLAIMAEDTEYTMHE